MEIKKKAATRKLQPLTKKMTNEARVKYSSLP